MEGEEEEEERDHRAHWGRKLEYLSICVGNAVGLGNVWRFPYLMYSNGGGAFFIPYLISMFVMGIPLFCLEVHYGQFCSQGPLSIWEINPLFKGLGYSMVILAAIISIYYNVVVATAAYFFFASLERPLPWTTCGNGWNTCNCRTQLMDLPLSDPMLWYYSSGLNCTGYNYTTKSIKSSTDEYYYNSVLQASDGLDKPGKLLRGLTLCNLVLWIVIAATLIKGVRTMGKVSYISAILPYVVLSFLIARGVTLEGANEGLRFYLQPDFTKLRESKVWKDAATQIFFSLSCCTGSLLAMSSYTDFKNNFVMDSLLIPIINASTSFLAGLAIFSALGFMAHNTGKKVSEVTTEGPGLTFVVYPEALSQMPVPHIWSLLFFFMIICLGMGTQFPSVETVLTGLQDEFPALRQKQTNVVFRVVVCLLLFLLGLPHTTQGGIYLLDLCDLFAGWPLILVGAFEVISLVWIYGATRNAEDVYIMIGGSPCSWRIYKYYIHHALAYATPCLISFILIFEATHYKPINSDPSYPWWAETMGWLMVTAIMISVPGFYVVRLYRAFGARDPKKRNYFEVLRNANQPTALWGPRHIKDKVNTRYGRKPSWEYGIPLERQMQVIIQMMELDDYAGLFSVLSEPEIRSSTQV